MAGPSGGKPRWQATDDDHQDDTSSGQASTGTATWARDQRHAPTGPTGRHGHDSQRPAQPGSATGRPEEKASTGTPARAAAAAASTDPPAPGPRNATSTDGPRDAARAATRARERSAKRARRGTREPPPAHQETHTPRAAAASTAGTAERRPAEPRPDGPKAAKTRSAEGQREAADNTSRSTPTQQPTRTRAPAPTAAATTEGTTAAKAADGARDPTKPTERPTATPRARQPPSGEAPPPAAPPRKGTQREGTFIARSGPQAFSFFSQGLQRNPQGRRTLTKTGGRGMMAMSPPVFWGPFPIKISAGVVCPHVPFLIRCLCTAVSISAGVCCPHASFLPLGGFDRRGGFSPPCVGCSLVSLRVARPLMRGRAVGVRAGENPALGPTELERAACGQL